LEGSPVEDAARLVECFWLKLEFSGASSFSRLLESSLLEARVFGEVVGLLDRFLFERAGDLLELCLVEALLSEGATRLEAFASGLKETGRLMGILWEDLPAAAALGAGSSCCLSESWGETAVATLTARAPIQKLISSWCSGVKNLCCQASSECKLTAPDLAMLELAPK
jgi:hypothetical protein